MKRTIILIFLAVSCILGCRDSLEEGMLNDPLQLRPNPIFFFVIISISNSHHEDYELTIADPSGKLIFQVRDNVESPDYTVPIDGPEGIYEVILRIGDITYSERLIRLKG